MGKIKKIKAPKRKPNGVSNGRVEKVSKKKLPKQVDRKKSNKQKARKIADDNHDENDRMIDKKKPSKADLKIVIDALKKDATLIMIRRALKYIPYYLKSEGLTKKLLKEVIRLWAEAGEKVRVICLLCLIRIYTKLKDDERKQQVIKQLYNSFLEKCRITKHETMSMIGFMRHSLIELYKLDSKIAFKQAQTSTQQLTITLKNAYTHKNEETYKTVLNWQFANCLILLSSLITSNEDDSPIKTLSHQVIQLNLGALNIISSPRYYPYYCHLIENLINLSISTNLFIPVLPLLVGIVDKIQIPKLKTKKESKESNKKAKSSNKNKRKNKNKDDNDDEDEEEDIEDDEDENDIEDDDDEIKKDAKTFNMDLLNHVSLDEAHSLEYNSAVLDKVYELLVKYLASQCHRIAFPELVLLPCVQLKKWIKKCPSQQHSQKFKSLMEKIKTDCEKIEEAKKSINFAFNNYNAVDAWEKRMRDSNELSLPKILAQ